MLKMNYELMIDPEADGLVNLEGAADKTPEGAAPQGSRSRYVLGAFNETVIAQEETMGTPKEQLAALMECAAEPTVKAGTSSRILVRKKATHRSSSLVGWQSHRRNSLVG